MQNEEDASAPFFAAYVYPGWHASPYRPSIDEWALLDNFTPYFEGHEPPPRPLQRYDDSLPATALEQVSLAQMYGVDAFTYFLYYRANEFVLADPIEAALSLEGQISQFGISLTWCIRLPHPYFPITVSEKSLAESPTANSHSGEEGGERRLPPEHKPLEELTLGDIEYLLTNYLQDALDSLRINPLIGR